MRFAALLEFELDPATEVAVRDMAEQLRVVSWERITQELRKMLLHRQRHRALALCEQLGLLAEFLPELNATSLPFTLQLLDQLDQPTFPLAMAALLHDVPVGATSRARDVPDRGTVSAVCRRMKLSNSERERIEWLVSHQSAFAEAPALTLAELKQLLAHPGQVELRQLADWLEQVRGGDARSLRFVDDYVASHSPEEIAPPELIGGAELIEQGVSPGPEFRRLLNAVRTAQLNETIATREQAVSLLQKMLSE